MKKTICVISGSRSDYGPLRPLLYLLNDDKQIKLQIAVTGSHLSSQLGSTYREIERDGFSIYAKVNIFLTSDTPRGMARSVAYAIAKFSLIYEKMRPDIIVVLGDRFEIFGAVTAAHISRIPVAHISGGEITEGSIDDAFRHCITKMSHLHFTAIEEYRRRVIQLGECPENVYNVGELSLDNIKHIKVLSKKELETRLNYKFRKKNLLVTFHPATAGCNSPKSEFSNLLRALETRKDTGIIFTKANADYGGRLINSMIDRYVNKHKDNATVFSSLGWMVYISVLRYVDAVVGNSSSGLIEAPSFKIGTINIGDRQTGRVKAKSVIDCKADYLSITRSFNTLYSNSFKKILLNVKNPYEGSGGIKKVFDILKYSDPSKMIRKRFYTIECCLK